MEKSGLLLSLMELMIILKFLTPITWMLLLLLLMLGLNQNIRNLVVRGLFQKELVMVCLLLKKMIIVVFLNSRMSHVLSFILILIRVMVFGLILPAHTKRIRELQSYMWMEM